MGRSRNKRSRGSGGGGGGGKRRKKKGLMSQAKALRREAHRANQSRKHEKSQQEREKKKREQRARASTRIPFDINDHILLVGEGNFSFALALATILRNKVKDGEGSGTDQGHYEDGEKNDNTLPRLVATCYDSESAVESKYEDAMEKVSALREMGVPVHFSVDATDLPAAMKRKAIRTNFSKIVFNFPHTGCGEKDTLKNIQRHQSFLCAFLQSARKLLLRSETLSNSSLSSSVIITLKRGEPYTSWKLPSLGTRSGFRVKTALPFFPEMYPGYQHRRTLGEAFDKEAVKANQDITKKGANMYILVPTSYE
eukprot:g4314.t1